jgi:hypothetical protein
MAPTLLWREPILKLPALPVLLVAVVLMAAAAVWIARNTSNEAITRPSRPQSPSKAQTPVPGKLPSGGQSSPARPANAQTSPGVSAASLTLALIIPLATAALGGFIWLIG